MISGDTTPTQALLDHSRVSPNAQDYRRRHHTSSIELAEIANELKSGLLVIYHRSNMGATSGSADSEDVLLSEIKDRYKGRVVAGHDLDVF